MNIVEATQINKFASEMQAEVSPSEQIFVLTSTQLQEIITQGVYEATKSLNSKVKALESRITQLEGDRTKFEALEKNLDVLSENQFIQLQLINDLRKDREPQPLQKDRGEILRALLVANGSKMLSTEARKKMHLSRSLFSQLLATMKDDIEVKPYYLNKSWKLLMLK
jgi:hypothetical protein